MIDCCDIKPSLLRYHGGIIFETISGISTPDLSIPLGNKSIMKTQKNWKNRKQILMNTLYSSKPMVCCLPNCPRHRDLGPLIFGRPFVRIWCFVYREPHRVTVPAPNDAVREFRELPIKSMPVRLRTCLYNYYIIGGETAYTGLSK